MQSGRLPDVPIRVARCLTQDTGRRLFASGCRDGKRDGGFSVSSRFSGFAAERSGFRFSVFCLCLLRFPPVAGGVVVSFVSRLRRCVSIYPRKRCGGASDAVFSHARLRSVRRERKTTIRERRNRTRRFSFRDLSCVGFFFSEKGDDEMRSYAAFGRMPEKSSAYILAFT